MQGGKHYEYDFREKKIGWMKEEKDIKPEYEN
jgi:hypothetical protein